MPWATKEAKEWTIMTQITKEKFRRAQFGLNLLAHQVKKVPTAALAKALEFLDPGKGALSATSEW